MFTDCATAAPMRHPPGEAHSLPAPAPLVTPFVAGPLPVNRASEVASRCQAAHPMVTRRPLSSPLSLSATPQLQPAQPLRDCVAKNASGDTRRHATARLAGVGSPLPLAAFHAEQAGSPGWRTRLPGRRSRKRPIRRRTSHKQPGRCSCRPPHRQRRRPNSNPPNKFGLLSPKTHQTTQASRDTKHVEARHDQSQATTRRSDSSSAQSVRATKRPSAGKSRLRSPTPPALAPIPA